MHNSSDPGGAISYVYNPEDKIKQITSPSGNTVIGYDDYGYQSSLEDIDAGTIEYTYNAFGELESQTDAKGNHQTLVYDNMGRTQSLSWNGGDSVLYNYDDRTGQLRSITSSNGIKKRFEYDELNRLSERIDSINGGNRFTAAYNYLSSGEIDNVVLNQDVTIDYTYNDYGYLDQVSANSELVWDAGSMNEYGITDNFTLGNQAVTSINYDSYGFIDGIVTVKGGTYLQNWNYDFNTITGNLTSRTGSNSSGNSVTESFTYDDLNRLLTYTAGQDTLSVSYDGSGYGNITGKTDVGTYDYTGGVHNVTSVTNPTVLMQNKPKQHIEYTKFNKVGYIRDSLNTGAERELFITYGPDQQRVKTLYKEDGRDVKTKYKALGQYEKETDSTGNVRELYYISGSDGVVAALQRMNEQDSIFYINKDHLGSFDVITNPDGSVRERYNYDPWGRRRNPTDWSYNNVPEEFFLDRGFTGHEHLDKFELINMNGRVYDQVMAMFLSPDNFVQSPDLTQNFNRYTYCLNNPLVYSDPSGYTYKAYMDYIYDEDNYWYRGQAPGTWTDWESFHNISGGGTGSYGSGIITTTDINSLLNSAHGGGWSTGTGTYFYASQDEAFIKSSFFIEANNLWGTTLFGDFNSAINAYDGGRLADEIRANNPEFYLTSLNSGDPKTISLQDLAPKQDFRGFWGGLKYFFTGGYVGGYSYNIKGEVIGLAPITGMAPTPGFARGMKVIQTGGHVLTPTTLKALNMTKEEGKYAIESMKKANGLSNNFHGKILKNGDVLDSFGNFIDNLLDYLH